MTGKLLLYLFYYVLYKVFAAVSYTHLDVYKRQMKFLSRFLMYFFFYWNMLNDGTYEKCEIRYKNTIFQLFWKRRLIRVLQNFLRTALRTGYIRWIYFIYLHSRLYCKENKSTPSSMFGTHVRERYVLTQCFTAYLFFLNMYFVNPYVAIIFYRFLLPVILILHIFFPHVGYLSYNFLVYLFYRSNYLVFCPKSRRCV